MYKLLNNPSNQININQLFNANTQGIFFCFFNKNKSTTKCPGIFHWKKPRLYPLEKAQALSTRKSPGFFHRKWLGLIQIILPSVIYVLFIILQTVAPEMKMSNRKCDLNYKMEKILIRGSHGVKLEQIHTQLRLMEMIAESKFVSSTRS